MDCIFTDYCTLGRKLYFQLYNSGNKLQIIEAQTKKKLISPQFSFQMCEDGQFLLIAFYSTYLNGLLYVMQYINNLFETYVKQMAELFFDWTHMPCDIFPRSGETRVHTWWFKRTKTPNQILQKHLSFKFKFVSVTLDHKSGKQQTRNLVLDKEESFKVSL